MTALDAMISIGTLALLAAAALFASFRLSQRTRERIVIVAFVLLAIACLFPSQ